MTRWPSLWQLLTGEPPKDPKPSNAASTLGRQGHAKRRAKVWATCDRLRAELEAGR